MKHYIIVKFTEGTDVKALVEPVREIFEETPSEMEKGVRGRDREEGDLRL